MQEEYLHSKIDHLLQIIARQELMINDLQKVVQNQQHIILLQSEKIATLEEEVKILKTGKNSQNSSKPPSTDNYIKRSLRNSSGKKSGGQAGHQGHTLEITSTPDQIIAHEPNFCRQCGNDLQYIVGNLVNKRQIVDIPVCMPNIVEHQIFCKKCKCGHNNIGDFPNHLNSYIQYGPSIESLIAYLSVRQYMPYQRIAEYLRDYYNLPLSEGTIANILERFAQKAILPYQIIKANLIESPVVGSDETGARVNGGKAWMHTWQDNKNTYIVCSPFRGSKAIEEQFPLGFPNSILVSDAWPAQLKTPAKGHQLCLAHLQRELKYFIEVLKIPWAEKINNLFSQAINAKRNNDLGSEIYSNFQESLECILSEDLQLSGKINAFRKRLIKNKNSLFRFLLLPQIPSDNNGSERAIRNIKVKQKISGHFKSWKGANCFAIIRSVIDTIIKRKLNLSNRLVLIAKLHS